MTKAGSADLSRWVTPSQAANLLGVSAQTVRSWCDRGRLTSARTILGRLIDPDSVQEIQKERSDASTTQSRR